MKRFSLKKAVLLGAVFLGFSNTSFAIDDSPMPEFVRVSEPKGELSMSAYVGKVVYLDFWASWCGPCKHSLPWLNKVQQKFGSSKFQVVAINLDERREDAEKALQDAGANLNVIFDPSGKMPEKFGVESMPTSFLFDKHGKMVATLRGFSEEKESQIESQIESLLNN